MLFTYGTIVKVIAGFYIGCTGIVNGYRIGKWLILQPDLYEVTLRCPYGDSIAFNQNVWLSPTVLNKTKLENK